MQTIEFNYDDIKGRELNIIAEVHNGEIKFKTYLFDKKIANSSLSTLDFTNIKEFILANAEDDIDTESDYLDRQSD